MSGRFVRASSFRHVHGAQAKPAQSFTDLRPLASGDGDYICGNHKFFALPVVGGGGPVLVRNLEDVGRVGSNVAKVSVHKGKVLDVQFSPVNYSLLATASEDCHLAVTQIPEGGVKEHIRKPLVDLSGHQKKVTNLRWHPVANNVLASGSADHVVRVWDIATQQSKLAFEDCKEVIHDISWNTDGSLLAVLSKDHKVRMFDPRAATAVQEFTAFTGIKKGSVRFADKTGKILCVGFSRSGFRQVQVWDSKDLSKAASTKDVDQSAGIQITHYDPDNNILYLGGKGDSSIKYFELVDNTLHFLSEFRDTSSQKGLCFLPKRACDTRKVEIAKALRVQRDAVKPVSFQVPRKSDIFQQDLYPDTYAGVAGLEADEWFSGKNKAPVMTSMRPGEETEVAAAAVAVSKSPAEYEAEIAKLKARIKELEA